MGLSTRILGATLFALLTATAAAAPAQTVAAAAAVVRTISNVANIQWEAEGRTYSADSNRVDIVVDEVARRPFTIAAYRFAGNSNSVRLPLTAPMCEGSGGTVPVALAKGWQEVALSPASALAVTQVRAGEPLIFVLTYAGGNLDPKAVDHVSGLILTKSGDREVLTVAETGPDTGVFAGFIQTAAVPPPFTKGDCRLTVEAGDTILVESLKSGTQTPLAVAEFDVLVDPFGTAFDSVSGEPVSGTTVTLLDADTGRPAEVFGDDGNSGYPATMVSGSSVQDSSGATYSYEAGEYRFPLVRPGRYRLKFEPPPGYFAPSARTAEQMAGLHGTGGLPYRIVEASYGGVFVVDTPEPVRISLPLDKIGSPILLSKQASKSSAEPGETLRFTITVTNPDGERPTAGVTVTDNLPQAMRLRAGTVRLDDAAVAADVDPDGRSFRVRVPALAPHAVASISYAIDVRADARAGGSVNKAEAVDDHGNRSSVADSSVCSTTPGSSL